MSIHKQWVDCKSVRRTKSPYIIGIRTYRAIYNQNNELSNQIDEFRYKNNTLCDRNSELRYKYDEFRDQIDELLNQNDILKNQNDYVQSKMTNIISDCETQIDDINTTNQFVINDLKYKISELSKQSNSDYIVNELKYFNSILSQENKELVVEITRLKESFNNVLLEMKQTIRSESDIIGSLISSNIFDSNNL